MSIAENLNCDYSDISSLFHEPHEEAGAGQGQLNTSDEGVTCEHEESESVTRMVINNLIILLLVALVKLVTFINKNPILSLLCLLIAIVLVKINSF